MIETLQTRKVVTAIIVVALIFGAMFAFTTAKANALTEAQIQSILSLLSSFGAEQATIDNVDASLRGQPTSGTGTGTGSGNGFTFTQNLVQGDTGNEVMELQKFLNTMSDTQVASSGAGSPGNETSFFGPATRAAVIKFQNKYAADVLTPVGLSTGTGFWGPSSRAKANTLNAGSGTGTGTGTGTTNPPATGTGLTVSAAQQVAASLAPDSAARVPFTKFNVTAGTDGAVTLDSVTVKRVGLGANASFAGIVLLDSNGVQLGTAKTLGSNDQAKVGESVTIPAGTTRTFTVAGNMASDNSLRAGEVVGLDVVAVNTSAAVSGSLPISGTQHTINATLTIGAATLNVSSFDPNTAQTKEIGTTGVRLSGIRVTAGSAEDIRIRNIRWNQTGSAGSTDISNVMTVVDGTEYPTTVSADGKFYTANFGSGVVVNEGNNIDIYVKADILSGASRTVFMDIDKDTDIYVTGETFNYGITPSAGSTSSASETSSQFTTGTPFFDGSRTTISAGSVTTIQKSASVAAQNVAVNVPNQPLGAFETDIKGEAINISGMTFTVATSTGGTGNDLLTNVSIVDQNGSVVAGPVDATDPTTSDATQTLTFTDSITLPTGKQVYSLQGKIGSDQSNGITYTVTVDPSTWTSPTGDVTGNTISISNSSFTLNTMTVKAAALDISISPTPVAQNITAGAQDFTFANVQLDATQSGEDVRFSSLELSMTYDVTVSEVTACQLFDGSTVLNTGSNVVNPSAASDAGETFTFDQALTVAKGTVKTLALKCDLASTVANDETVAWGINSDANPTVTGVTSSNSVTETITASAGQTMTVAAASLVASEDAASPSYQIVAGGSTGVTMGTINFRAANEAITLQRVGLTLTNTASSSASDLVQVGIYDGATKVGSAIFTGSNTNATSTLTTPVTLPKDTDKDLIVKVDLANIGTSQAGTQGALIAVDIDTANTNTQGVGQESGTTVNASGSTTFEGVRVFRSYPTVTKLSGAATTLTTATDVDLYRFSITASAGGSGIGLTEVNVNLATSTGSAVSGTTTVTNLEVRAYTDASFSSPVSGFTNGVLATAISEPLGAGGNDNAVAFSSILQIPAGQTRYFRVLGDTTLTAGTGTFSGSVTTRLAGDAAYPVLSGLMGAAATIQADTNDDFVWSPNATTTSAAGHIDWTNGYFVSGLPSDGTDAHTISK